MLLVPPIAPAAAYGGAAVSQGMMIHARQVLERYDASSQPMLQYLELWMDSSRVLQRELAEDGHALAYAFSDGDTHLSWNPETLKADKPEASKVFLMDYTALKTGFGAETRVPGQVYAGRLCTAILFEASGNEEDWLKLYLDNETDFVLFCEAPLFRLRTALLETLPADEAHLTPPAGLIF